MWSDNCRKWEQICMRPEEMLRKNASYPVPVTPMRPVPPGLYPFGCLQELRMPQWFYFKIATAGVLEFELWANTHTESNSRDGSVDYAMFGPFDTIEHARNTCGNYEEAHQLSCSFGTGDAPQRFHHNNFEADKIYVILVSSESDHTSSITEEKNKELVLRLMNSGAATAKIDCTPIMHAGPNFPQTMRRERCQQWGGGLGWRHINITGPDFPIGIKLTAWGGGGGREMTHQCKHGDGELASYAGPGGYAGAYYLNTPERTFIRPNEAFSVIVGQGGKTGNGIEQPRESNGFGGAGTNESGGGMSGFFRGHELIEDDQATRDRALIVAGGGPGYDCISAEAYGSWTESPEPGGMPGFAGSSDHNISHSCYESVGVENIHASAGGGGWNGGGRRRTSVGLYLNGAGQVQDEQGENVDCGHLVAGAAGGTSKVNVIPTEVDGRVTYGEVHADTLKLKARPKQDGSNDPGCAVGASIGDGYASGYGANGCAEVCWISQCVGNEVANVLGNLCCPQIEGAVDYDETCNPIACAYDHVLVVRRTRDRCCLTQPGVTSYSGQCRALSCNTDTHRLENKQCIALPTDEPTGMPTPPPTDEPTRDPTHSPADHPVLTAVPTTPAPPTQSPPPTPAPALTASADDASGGVPVSVMILVLLIPLLLLSVGAAFFVRLMQKDVEQRVERRAQRKKRIEEHPPRTEDVAPMEQLLVPPAMLTSLPATDDDHQTATAAAIDGQQPQPLILPEEDIRQQHLLLSDMGHTDLESI